MLYLIIIYSFFFFLNVQHLKHMSYVQLVNFAPYTLKVKYG